MATTTATTGKASGKATEKKEKTLGEKIMGVLKRAADAVSTADLAKRCGVEPKDAYARAWWLEQKEGLLKSRGKGKDREWKLSAKGVKFMSPAPAAPKATEARAEA